MKKQIALSMVLVLCISTLNAMDPDGYFSSLYNSLYNRGAAAWQSLPSWQTTKSYLPYMPTFGLQALSPYTMKKTDDYLKYLAQSDRNPIDMLGRNIPPVAPASASWEIPAAALGYLAAPSFINLRQFLQRYGVKSDKRFNKIIYGAPVLMQAAALIAFRLISGESIVSILRDTPIRNALTGLAPSLIPAFLAVVAEFVADYYRGETPYDATAKSETERKSGL